MMQSFYLLSSTKHLLMKRIGFNRCGAAGEWWIVGRIITYDLFGCDGNVIRFSVGFSFTVRYRDVIFGVLRLSPSERSHS